MGSELVILLRCLFEDVEIRVLDNILAAYSKGKNKTL